MTQREAAVEAVRKIGLRQICEMDMSEFGDRKKEAEMFRRRLQNSSAISGMKSEIDRIRGRMVWIGV